jgi:hypothetical protein
MTGLRPLVMKKETAQQKSPSAITPHTFIDTGKAVL